MRALEVELPLSAQQGMLSLEKPNKQTNKQYVQAIVMAHRKRLTPGKALAMCRQGDENIFLNDKCMNIGNSTLLPWNNLHQNV